ncbi:MAG: LysM peptidoglycan-binding domain-containing protein [Candidatus Saccharibacteria bacterium]
MVNFNLVFKKDNSDVKRKTTNWAPPPQGCSGFLYTVQTGDTLYFIAERMGVPLNLLIEANPQIADPNLIYPGQRICIPAYSPEVDAAKSDLPVGFHACFTVLHGTEFAPESVGAALIFPHDPAWVLVAGFRLPDPSSFDPDYDTYKAWIIESQHFSRFRLDMRHIVDGIWIAFGRNGSLEGFDEVLVTPETAPGITTPTGPVVLRGSLGNCIQLGDG